MSKRSINIERLNIRLQGIAPQSARAAVNNLGQDLLNQLAGSQHLSGVRRTVKISHIDSGAFQLGAGTTPGQLRSVMAERIASSIRSKLK